MLLKKTDQRILESRQDLLVAVPNGNFVVEINQRSESDMLWILQNYMEMDREMALLNCSYT